MTTPEAIAAIKAKHQKSIMKKKNVIGLGVGYKETKGKRTDELCLVVMVEKKEDVSTLRKKDQVPRIIDGIRTDVKQVGKIVAQKLRTSRWRPAPGGVSIGHYAITAGTLGAAVHDVESNEILILSNNHVLANSNDARIGDSIIQPGAADGGKDPQDRIADLERFVKIQFKDDGGENGGSCPFANAAAAMLNLSAKIVGSKSRLTVVKLTATNEVDAAVAKPAWDNVVEEDLYEIGKVTGTVEPAIGMTVQKSGRTSGVTQGTIDAVDVTVEVSYGGGKTATFEHQVMTNDMSDPGDSGSLVVDLDRRAVGLLFAGSDEVTIFNPIQTVMERLKIKFV